MINRRKFLLSSLAASFGISLPARTDSHPSGEKKKGPGGPVFISTWEHGLPANEAAMNALLSGASVLDAVEAGVRVTEADPEVSSVGYGGRPDADGNVTLDACIMDKDGNAGAVACLEHIKHPVSVARRVMEKTPHVMLVGEGALRFAQNEGFPRENLLTPKAREAWEKWKEGTGIGRGHDTIGMVAMDASGNLSGACTTSGMAFKLPGRVGDSPIIGAGLYVANDIGGAAATGHGELVLKTLGSFLVVELMRNGYGPTDACREALERIREKIPVQPDQQVGYIALDKSGMAGGYSLRKGFSYSLFQNGKNRLFETPCLL